VGPEGIGAAGSQAFLFFFLYWRPLLFTAVSQSGMLCCVLCLVLCAQAIKTGFLHPTLNLDNPDAGLVSALPARWAHPGPPQQQFAQSPCSLHEKCAVRSCPPSFARREEKTGKCYLSAYVWCWCEQDPSLMVRGTKEPLKVKVALSNSFGFGGHNSSILFRRPTTPTGSRPQWRRLRPSEGPQWGTGTGLEHRA